MISKRQFFLGLLASSLLGGVIVLLGMSWFGPSDNSSTRRFGEPSAVSTSFGDIDPSKKDYIVPEGINFIKASRAAVPAVVHITNTSTYKRSGRWSNLFGRERKRQSTGSGVLISADGYIATNYHVVEDAEELEVRLDDNRRIEAEVIGVDEDTDLALIKIRAQDLPYVDIGNSDLVEIGEWVLAVGNPFDLNNTVTAGIVSAKARNINLIQSSDGGRNNYGIESFIQTDAVVNRGNSGGALVNLDGELIGINTAIATNTGTFNGYSFAVPSILVKKVMDDLLEFGKVQRGLLGVSIQDADGTRGTDELSGVLVASLNPGGAAEDAGIKEGDVIVGIDERKISTTSELQEFVARKRPGDRILVKYKRNGRLKETNLTLKKKSDLIAALPADEVQLSYEIEGSTFINIDEVIKTNLKVEGGVQLLELKDGAWSKAGIKEGFVITKVGDRNISNLEEFQQVVDSKTRDFYVMGKHPNGEKDYYRVNW